MIYANAGWCEKELDTAALRKDYQIWMARYNTYTYKESKDKGQRYGGQIVSGNAVTMQKLTVSIQR